MFPFPSASGPRNDPEADHAPRYGPERKLWTAVLEDALRTYLGVGTCGSPLEQCRARRWVEHTHGEGCRAPVGSFEWVCVQLDVSADGVRGALLAMEQAAGGRKDVLRKAFNKTPPSGTRRRGPDGAVAIPLPNGEARHNPADGGSGARGAGSCRGV